MNEIQEQLQILETRLKALESKTSGIQPNAFLNQITIDPQSSGFLQDFIAIPYDTTIPTFAPRKNGYQRIIKTGGNYYLYIYLDGSWKRTQLT